MANRIDLARQFTDLMSRRKFNLAVELMGDDVITK
jgi:hypothetical protein